MSSTCASYRDLRLNVIILGISEPWRCSLKVEKLIFSPSFCFLRNKSAFLVNTACSNFMLLIVPIDKCVCGTGGMLAACVRTASLCRQNVCVYLRSEVWRSFKGTCSLQEIQGLVSSAVIQFHRHFQQEDLIWLKM